jgi:hypothetical protein
LQELLSEGCHRAQMANVAMVVAAVNSVLHTCDKLVDLIELSDECTKLGLESMNELASRIVADTHAKMERLLSLAEEPMAQYDHDVLLGKIRELDLTATALVAVWSRFEPHGYAEPGACLGRWCSLCGGNGQDRGYKARLHSLRQVVNDVKSAVNAVQLSSVEIGGATVALYQPPRQLAEVMKALLKGVKLVVVSGGPAMGKSSLAREVKRRVEAAEVRDSVFAPWLERFVSCSNGWNDAPCGPATKAARGTHCAI